MTPSEMDALYPRMNPRMSQLVDDIYNVLSASWTPDELSSGKKWAMPIDEPRGHILAEYFMSQSWHVAESYNPYMGILLFTP